MALQNLVYKQMMDLPWLHFSDALGQRGLSLIFEIVHLKPNKRISLDANKYHTPVNNIVANDTLA